MAITKNLRALLENHQQGKTVRDSDGKYVSGAKPIVVLEGSARSSKTYSVLEYLIMYLYQHVDVATVFRHDAATHDKAAFRDFQDIMLSKYLPLWDAGKLNKSMKTFTFANGSVIEFAGTNDAGKLQGPARGIAFLNECIEISYEAYRQINARTRKLVICDFNPSLTKAWIFDRVMGRDDCLYVHSTFRDNPHLDAKIIQEIESTNPNIIDNVRQGTADAYFWDIYGLGKRAKREGVIFKDYFIAEPDEWPAVHNCQRHGYGLDFGFSTDECAMIECCLFQSRIYVREIFYETNLITTKSHADPNRRSIQGNLEDAGVSLSAKIVADSARPEQISELNTEGYCVTSVKKFPGSIVAGIDLMRSYPIYVHRDSQNIQQELDQYAWRRKPDGTWLNEPEDKWNHCFIGSTVVCTSRGGVRIDSLSDSDEVLTREGFKQIEWQGQTGIKEVFDVIMDNGEVLTGTSGHNIFTNQGKKSIDALRYGDTLIGIKSNKEHGQWSKLNSTEENTTGSQIQRNTLTRAITNAKGACITAICTNHIAEKYRKALRFTIKILTRSIMTLEIWSALKKKSIGNCTQKEIKEGALKSKKPTSIKYATSQRNGTGQKTGFCGIQCTGKKRIKSARQSARNVQIVAKCSRQKHSSKSSALINVNQLTVVNLVLMMLRLLVLTVAKLLKSTNTISNDSVRVLAVLRTGQKVPVFNLRVNGPHEYYASGVLVANCMDAIRYWTQEELPRMSIETSGGYRGRVARKLRRY